MLIQFWFTGKGDQQQLKCAKRGNYKGYFLYSNEPKYLWTRIPRYYGTKPGDPYIRPQKGFIVTI